jgi:hypothetical protein
LAAAALPTTASMYSKGLITLVRQVSATLMNRSPTLAPRVVR